jgi:hydrogenase nickel incorporation protein HypA/HybF
MHELGIMTGVMESAEKAARDAGANGVLKVSLQVGVMTEAIEDALQFAFEALQEANDYFKDAKLEVEMIQPKSICTECGHEFNHDRFHMTCPECGSPFLQLLEGKELQISSIEVDMPDEEGEEE